MLCGVYSVGHGVYFTQDSASKLGGMYSHYSLQAPCLAWVILL